MIAVDQRRLNARLDDDRDLLKSFDRISGHIYRSFGCIDGSSILIELIIGDVRRRSFPHPDRIALVFTGTLELVPVNLYLALHLNARDTTTRDLIILNRGDRTVLDGDQRWRPASPRKFVIGHHGC